MCPGNVSWNIFKGSFQLQMFVLLFIVPWILFKFIDPQGQHIFIYYCTYMADYNDQVDMVIADGEIFYV